MECPSILYQEQQPPVSPRQFPPARPDCFADLHLDQIEAAVAGDESDGGLESVFRQPLASVQAIRYRQDVFRDLAKPGMREGLERFAVAMCEVRRSLSHAALLSTPEQQRMWRLDAAGRYCIALISLDALLRDAPKPNPPLPDSPLQSPPLPDSPLQFPPSPDSPPSHGAHAGPQSQGSVRSAALGSFSRWLHALVQSDAFQAHAAACETLAGRMHALRFTLCGSDRMLHVGRGDAGQHGAGMDGGRVAGGRSLERRSPDGGSLKGRMVNGRSPGGGSPDGGSPDGTSHVDPCGGGNLVEAIRRTFSRVAPMPQPEAITFFTNLEMGALELQILACLRRMHPGAFDALAAWDKDAMPIPHAGLEQFDRELRFYLAWLRLRDALKPLGCPLSLPDVLEDAPLQVRGLYDLALVLKQRKPVVPNDCLLSGQERRMVLTGPNQGGKSTHARALGQTVWLSMLGVPVPARHASLGRFDTVLTHFATSEHPDSASGRLQDELLRIRSLFRAASGKSLVLFNELFSTTATLDAIALGRRVLAQIRSIGCHCLYVTHLAELADPEAGIVSLVAAVGSDDGEIRTFHIHRRPADGMAYAGSLAARYGLDADQVRRRIAMNRLDADQVRRPIAMNGLDADQVRRPIAMNGLTGGAR